jgi:predicted MFS family arabinose efflux permease
MLKSIFSAYKTSFYGLSRETWILSFVILLNRCGFMAVPFMGLYITQHLNRPESDAGIVISLFGLGSILGASLGGKLTDVVGFRPVQILAATFSGLFFIIFAFVDSFTWLCVLVVVISIFSEAFRPANYTAVATYAVEGTETRSYSLNRLATNIGFAVGASSGGLIASFNYKLLFVVDGAIGMLAALAILLFLPKAKKIAKEQNMVTSAEVIKPWQDPVYIKFLVICTLYITCFFLMFRVAPVFFKEEWKVDEALIGLILGVNGLIIALFEMVLISKIENKRSPKFYIILGLIISCVSFLCLMLPHSYAIATAIFCVVMFTVGEMLTLPFFNVFIVKRSNVHNRGLYAAGYTISWSIAHVIGPTAGFYIAQHFGYNTLWISIAIFLICCSYLFKSIKF